MSEKVPIPALIAPSSPVVDPALVGVDPKIEKLQRAEQWLNSQALELPRYAEVADEDTAIGEPLPVDFKQTEPVPKDIAQQVALHAQTRLGLWEKYDRVYDGIDQLPKIRNEALRTADELDFGVITATEPGDWRILTVLNGMHDKFRDVSVDEIRTFLGDGPGAEYKALYINNIVADHAPELLTTDLKTIMDPEQPLWRVASTHAAILFRARGFSARGYQDLANYKTAAVPTALPIRSRGQYVSEDDATMRPLQDMSADELALYVAPEAQAAVQDRGMALFGELNHDAQEALLTRRFFELDVKSNDPATKQRATERNKTIGSESAIQAGDLVHATWPKALSAVLEQGIQCTEGIVGNKAGYINYPFTVSFLEVTKSVSATEPIPSQLEALNNSSYGPINLVFQRDAFATDFGTEQRLKNSKQVQIFAGLPSSELKSIVIRTPQERPKTVTYVIDNIIKHGMFVPVFDGTTGEQLFTAEQFDKQRQIHSSIGKLATTK